MKPFVKQLIVTFLIAACFQAGAQSNIPVYLPAEGLVGWWPFTGNAIDSSGNGNNGVATNAILTTDRFGKSNAAYNFNGWNSRIDIPDAASLRCRKITLSAWVLNRNLAKTSQIIYKGTLTGDSEGYSLNSINGFASSAAKVGGNCVSGYDWKIIWGKNNLEEAVWEHIVTTYDGTDYKMYVNGVLDTTSVFGGLIDVCVGSQLRFGYNHNRWPQDSGDGFDGYIDDIAIWNRALSLTEITQLYTSTVECGYGNMGINVCSPERNLHVKDVMRLEPRNTAPSNPGKGDIYFDGILNKLRVYDGTTWQNCW